MNAGMNRYFLLALLLALSTSVFSQSVVFEHLNQNDGLPSPTVTAVMKDSYGFMWFGTRRGLVRYDGYSFAVFDEVPSETGEPVTNFFFRTIVQINDTTLLLVNNSMGIYLFHLNSEKFTLLLNTSKSADKTNSNSFYAAFIDKDHQIWLGSNYGLSLFDFKTKSFTNFPLHNYPEFSSFKNLQYVTSIQQDEQGKLWMFCFNGYIAEFDVSTKTFRFIKYSSNSFASHIIHHGGKIHLDKKETVWIGTEYEGIYTYNRRTHEVVHYSKENKKLPTNAMMSFCEDASGTIWIGTDGGGLLRFNKDSETFELFKNNPIDHYSISGNAIYTVHATNDHHLWVGTYGAGLNIYKKDKQKFQKVTSQGETGKRLSYKSVLSFAEAPDGNVLIGTDGGGLNVFYPKTKKIDYFTTFNSTIHSDILNTLYFDKKGYLWIGSYGKGLCRYSYSNGKLQKSSKVYLNGKGIWKVIEDREGNVWIGSLNMIYTLPIGKDGKISSEPIVRLSAPFGVTNDMVVDSVGNVWVCTSSVGLCRFEKGTKQYSQIQTNSNKANSLLSNNVTSFYVDSKGQYLVGTGYGGVSRLKSFEKNEMERLGNGTNYFRTANSILEDDKKHLWISTDNGIVELKNNKEFV